MGLQKLAAGSGYTYLTRQVAALDASDCGPAMVRSAVGRTAAQPQASEEWVASAACRVVTTVEESRATWQVWHVRAEAERQARAAAIPLLALDATVARVVDQALAKLVHSTRSLPPTESPSWVGRIGPQTLVVIDEAGQGGTRDLADAVDFVVSRGGSVRLVG